MKRFPRFFPRCGLSPEISTTRHAEETFHYCSRCQRAKQGTLSHPGMHNLPLSMTPLLLVPCSDDCRLATPSVGANLVAEVASRPKKMLRPPPAWGFQNPYIKLFHSENFQLSVLRPLVLPIANLLSMTFPVFDYFSLLVRD